MMSDNLDGGRAEDVRNGVPRATLLGAGRLGSAVTRRCVADGWQMTVWNRTPGRTESLEGPGVTVASDPRAAVTGADVVVTAMTGGQALVDVLVDRGVLAAVPVGTALVDLSTVDVELSRYLARVAASHRVHYLRCAVGGTADDVEAGLGELFVSGSTHAVELADPLLGAVADTRHVVGEHDEARVVKLALNLMMAGATCLLSEVVVVAEASGVSRETLCQALDSSPIASTFLACKSQALVAQDYGPSYSAQQMRHDIEVVLDRGTALRIPMSLAVGSLAELDETCADGWGSDDCLSVVRLVQERAHRTVDKGKWKGGGAPG
ncbi:NAD(P)-dependent oxidoreductase [Kribbella swartbergensis]